MTAVKRDHKKGLPASDVVGASIGRANTNITNSATSMASDSSHIPRAVPETEQETEKH